MQFNRLIPELSVVDIEKTRHFYLDVLGFHLEYERPEDRFIMVSLQGSQLMLQQDSGTWETAPAEYPRGRGINIQLEVDDLDPFIAALRDEHIPLFVESFACTYREDDKQHECREFLVQDPDGYLLRFSQ